MSQAQRDIARICLENDITIVVAVGRDEPIRLLEDWGVVRRAAA
jgi:hypothetical protein